MNGRRRTVWTLNERAIPRKMQQDERRVDDVALAPPGAVEDDRRAQQDRRHGQDGFPGVPGEVMHQQEHHGGADIVEQDGDRLQGIQAVVKSRDHAHEIHVRRRVVGDGLADGGKGAHPPDLLQPEREAVVPVHRRQRIQGDAGDQREEEDGQDKADVQDGKSDSAQFAFPVEDVVNHDAFLWKFPQTCPARRNQMGMEGKMSLPHSSWAPTTATMMLLTPSMYRSSVSQGRDLFLKIR